MPPDSKPPLYEYLGAFYDKDADTHTPALIITARDDEGAVVMAKLLRCANNDAPVHILGRIGRDITVMPTGMPVPIQRDAAVVSGIEEGIQQRRDAAAAREVAKTQFDEILRRR